MEERSIKYIVEQRLTVLYHSALTEDIIEGTIGISDRVKEDIEKLSKMNVLPQVINGILDLAKERKGIGDYIAGLNESGVLQTLVDNYLGGGVNS